MKNLLSLTSLAILSSLLVSCGGAGYPKFETKAAKKACSCFKDVAQYKIKMENYTNKHSDKENYEEVYGEMERRYAQLQNKAEIICMEGWLRDQDDYADSMDIGSMFGAAQSICPEIIYHLTEGTKMSPDVNYNPLPEKDKDDKGGYEDYGSWEKENDRYENRMMEAEPMPDKEATPEAELVEDVMDGVGKGYDYYNEYDYEYDYYDDYDYDYDPRE